VRPKTGDKATSGFGLVRFAVQVMTKGRRFVVHLDFEEPLDA
jgi:hypothetical protein